MESNMPTIDYKSDTSDMSEIESSMTLMDIKSGLSTVTDGNIIDLIENFINKLNLSKTLKGICIITIAIDNSTLCSCFVFNYDTKEILKHYPQRYETNNPIYKIFNNKKFTINLSTNLPSFSEKGKHTGVEEDINYYPFCCVDCKKTTNKRLSNEIEFDNFINKRNSSRYIFSVTKKIQYGPLLFKKKFSLHNNNIKEEIENEDTHKINSFKLLTCSVHNTYYSIDLNTLDTSACNYHHAKGQNETFYGPLILDILKEI
jgi:hypothetical protein